MKEDIGGVSVKMEGGLMEQGGDRVGHVNKVSCVKRVIVKKRKPYNRRCNHKKAVSKVPKALQELFVSCRETFKGLGTVPSPQDVQKLCHILDNMKPEDVGLRSDLQFFKPENIVKENQRVTYTTIHRCENFSLCIFFLPAKGVIPLHNHPGMTVFSKLLLGQMHIKSYDWVDPEVSHNLLHQQPSQLRLARLKANNVFTAPCDTSVLYPKSGGNIHEFTAITPCAVLDVLGPPYSKEDGRDCSYYRDHPYAAFPTADGESAKAKEENDSFGWLEEIEMPENSQMDGIEYLGPPIIESAL
ncbi:plant cysteine oxidase 2-like [Abrus precatorius]|uniref:cysteine dioxygenase n=1 Tax=Abrus precatorius TaxID=3816 RepID=A0A8B8LWU5_ABRPR|nr:plant cysteine oxidase 2-like [Abrus precatorius]